MNDQNVTELPGKDSPYVLMDKLERLENKIRRLEREISQLEYSLSSQKFSLMDFSTWRARIENKIIDMQKSLSEKL